VQLDVSDLRVKKTSFEFNFAASLIDLGMTQPEEPARPSLQGGSDTARESQQPAPSTAQSSGPSWSSYCPHFALLSSVRPAPPCNVRQGGCLNLCSRRGLCLCWGRVRAVLPQHKRRWSELQQCCAGVSHPQSRSTCCAAHGCTTQTTPRVAVSHKLYHAHWAVCPGSWMAVP